MKIGGIQKLSLVDYPGKTSIALFTTGCNMRCGYCHNPELVLPERYADDLPIESVINFLKARQGMIDAVVISGGEPTMHDSLPLLAKQIKGLGYLVKLDSNGTHPEMLDLMIKNKSLDYIAMDIKGPLWKYSAIAARPIDTQAIERSVRLIISAPILHEFRTTIVKGLLDSDDFDSIGGLVKGAQRFALQKFIPAKTLNPQFSRKITFTNAELAIIKTKMEQYVDLCVIH